MKKITRRSKACLRGRLGPPAAHLRPLGPGLSNPAQCVPLEPFPDDFPSLRSLCCDWKSKSLLLLRTSMSDALTGSLRGQDGLCLTVDGRRGSLESLLTG